MKKHNNDLSTINWLSKDEIVDEQVVESRNLVAEKNSKESLDYLCNRSLGFGLDNLSKLVEIIDIINDKNGLRGSGIELGAGAGFLSSEFLLQFDSICNLHVLEISKEHVLNIIPKVMLSRLDSSKSSKSKLVIGDFDHIKLPDSSLDFAIEINSLHHSYNLPITLNKISRVLKPGGRLICCDGSHPTFTTDQDIEDLLNREYDPISLEKIGFPKGTIMKRRENGEHEYRDKDWTRMMHDAGFSVLKLEHIGEKISFNKIARALVARLPFSVRKILSYILQPLISKKIVKLIANKRYKPRRGEIFLAQ